MSLCRLSNSLIDLHKTILLNVNMLSVIMPNANMLDFMDMLNAILSNVIEHPNAVCSHPKSGKVC